MTSAVARITCADNIASDESVPAHAAVWDCWRFALIVCLSLLERAMCHDFDLLIDATPRG